MDLVIFIFHMSFLIFHLVIVALSCFVEHEQDVNNSRAC